MDRSKSRITFIINAAMRIIAAIALAIILYYDRVENRFKPPINDIWYGILAFVAFVGIDKDIVMQFLKRRV